MRAFIFLLILAVPAFAQERRALVDLVTGEVVESRVITKAASPTNPNPVRWMKVDRIAKPPFDPATQKLVADVTNDGATVTYDWNVVALTQAELDAIAAAETAETQRATRRGQLRGIMPKLRNGNATDAEVQLALWRLLRNLDFNE